MMHFFIILKTYLSLFCNHILHKFCITRHFLQIFYQKDIDGKIFQESDKTPVFTILSLLHRSLRECLWWYKNGNQLLWYLCFFHLFVHLFTTSSTTSSYFIIPSFTTDDIGGSIVCLPSDCHAMSIIFKILKGTSRKNARLSGVHSSGQLDYV